MLEGWEAVWAVVLLVGALLLVALLIMGLVLVKPVVLWGVAVSQLVEDLAALSVGPRVLVVP